MTLSTLSCCMSYLKTEDDQPVSWLVSHASLQRLQEDLKKNAINSFFLFLYFACYANSFFFKNCLVS